MKLAIDVPNFGDYAHPRTIADLARDVEAAGWDGFSLWDHILYFSGNPVGDPWVQLTAAATVTERIRLIMNVTPLPRRRPWVVARQAVSLDQLSGGRLILGLGIGAPPEEEFGAFGEPTDARTRADMLDEGLEIIAGMWSGEPFSFEGMHYRLEENAFRPTPAQQPRIPIWVAGAWPNKRPFRRAAHWDGVSVIKLTEDGFGLPSPADVAAMRAYIDRHRSVEAGYDLMIVAVLPSDAGEARELISSYEEAGATWLRLLPAYGGDPTDFVTFVKKGPPLS